MNKTYLLVELGKCADCGKDWIINQDVGIESIYGYRQTEKEADEWAKEQCRYEMCGADGSIEPFEKEVYINQRTFEDDEGNHRKRAVTKGYFKKCENKDVFPVFAFIEVYENKINKKKGTF